MTTAAFELRTCNMQYSYLNHWAISLRPEISFQVFLSRGGSHLLFLLAKILVLSKYVINSRIILIETKTTKKKQKQTKKDEKQITNKHIISLAQKEPKLNLWGFSSQFYFSQQFSWTWAEIPFLKRLQQEKLQSNNTLMPGVHKKVMHN